MTYPFLDRLRVIESSAFIAAPLAGLTLVLATDARVSAANPVFERIDTPGVGAHLAAGSRRADQATLKSRPRAILQSVKLAGSRRPSRARAACA